MKKVYVSNKDMDAFNMEYVFVGEEARNGLCVFTDKNYTDIKKILNNDLWDVLFDFFDANQSCKHITSLFVPDIAIEHPFDERISRHIVLN